MCIWFEIVVLFSAPMLRRGGGEVGQLRSRAQKKRCSHPTVLRSLSAAAAHSISSRPPRPGQSITASAAAASGNVPRPPRQPLGESLVRIRGWVKFKLLNTPIQHACSTVRGIWSLTLVGLTMILTGPPLCPAAMPTLPNSHLPQQNHADRGGAN